MLKRLGVCYEEMTRVFFYNTFSSVPLVTGSILMTQSLAPPQSKPHPSHQHTGSKAKGKVSSVKDRPLTFKSKIRSSGYTQQPRYSLLPLITKGVCT